MSPFSFLLCGSSHLYWISGVNLCLLVLSSSPAQSLMMTMTSPCSLGLHCGPIQLLSLDSRTQPEHKSAVLGLFFLTWLYRCISSLLRSDTMVDETLDAGSSDLFLSWLLCTTATCSFLQKVHVEHLLCAGHYTTAGTIIVSNNVFLFWSRSSETDKH